MIDEYFVEKIFDSIMAYGGELELSSPYQPEGRDIRRIKVASFRHNFDEGNLKHVDWNTYVEMVRNVVGCKYYCVWVRDEHCDMKGVMVFYDGKNEEVKMKHINDEWKPFKKIDNICKY